MPRLRPHSWQLIFLLVAILMAAAGILYPIRTLITRSLITASIATAILLLTLLLRKKRFLLYPWLTLLAAFTLFLLLPARPIDPIALQSAYTSALQSYDGTTYVWGGENSRGIDCSGLIRAAMIDATLTESLRTLNPALLRESLWLWFHDIPAKDMPAGYDNHFTTLTQNTSLENTNPALLLPGSVAVTSDGSHVIAYLSHNQWIEADPGPNHVLTWHTQENPTRMNMHFSLLHWKLLEQAP